MLKNLVHVAVACLTAGCATQKSNESKEATPEAQANSPASNKDFVGHWKSKCVQQTVKGTPTGKDSLIVSVALTQDTMTMQAENFTGTKCEKKRGSMRFVYGYVLGKPVARPEGAVEFDTTLKQAYIESQDPSFLAKLNKNSGWEQKNWQSGIEKDITGRKFSPSDKASLFNAGERGYSILKLENDKLYLGNEANEAEGKTPEKRHSTLLMQVPLSRVP